MADEVECTAYLGGTRRVPRDRLQWRPSAYALVVDQGRLLVVTLSRSGRLYLPGGAVELGETMAAAVQREAMEETGLQVAVGELAGVQESIFYFDPADQAYHALLFYHHCTPLTFELRRDGEIDEGEVEKPGWVPVEGLRAEDFHANGEFIMGLLSAARPDP